MFARTDWATVLIKTIFLKETESVKQIKVEVKEEPLILTLINCGLASLTVAMRHTLSSKAE